MSVQDDIRRVQRMRAQRTAEAVPPPPPEPDRTEVLLEDMGQILAILAEAALTQPLPEPPLPPPDPIDLSPFVAAVQALKPGAPDEIGKAIARHLPPPAEPLGSEQLEKLLKTVGNNVSYPIAGGGGTVGLRAKAITDLTATLAKDATVAHQSNKFQPEVRTTKALSIATSGDNTIVIPAAGLKLRVHWVGMSSSENNTAEVVATVKFAAGGAAKYIWNMGAPGAFSHWEPIDGATDEALIVSLSGAQTVKVNVTYEEI